MVIGPHALGLIGSPAPSLVEAFQSPMLALAALHTVYEVLAQVGVIVLLFFVGLETRLEDLISVGWRALLVATGGIALPFALGYYFTVSRGYATLPAVFTATALVATSIGITAHVLAELGALRRVEARIILGAAVLDDILGMILLAVVASVSERQGISWGQIALIGAEAVAFVGFVVLVGRRIIPRYDARLNALRIRNSPFTVAIAVCLGLAALAGYVGLAAIIGAFFAGMVFAESRQRQELIDRTTPVYDLLVPFFFVLTGASVDPALLLDPRFASLALMLTLLAIIGKLVGCSIGTLGLRWRQVGVVGAGMVPRGEVGLIVASLGRSSGVLPEELFSAVVLMSAATTLAVPPALGLLYRGELQAQPGGETKEEDSHEVNGVDDQS